MVEVIINGTKIDLVSKGIKYTKQANDLADVSTVNTSFTYRLRVDKTPRNTRLFQQLGMVGDTSNFPYVKNTAQLIDDGAVLIPKGIPTIKETKEDYDLFIQDGIVEIFKAIQNKSLGIDLDLPELVHNKTAATIKNSWTGLTKYRYLIADYNGKTNEGETIDPQYQIPSVNVKYLWDKVFDYLGYTYSGDFNFIQNKWITYPKPPELLEGDITSSFTGITSSYQGSFNDSYKQWNITGPEPLLDATLLNNWKVRIGITASYKFTFYGTGEMEYKGRAAIGGNYTANMPFRINLLVNGEIVDFMLSTGFIEDRSFNQNLQAGAVIELSISPIEVEDLTTLGIEGNFTREIIKNKDYSIFELRSDSIYLNLDTTAREVIDFREVLKDFSIKDFFKEVLFRGALTPFVDNINKHIEFVSLSKRLKINSKNTIDLSSKVIKRVNEFYSFNSYAQKNVLRLKYNNPDENYNDGNLYVENKNLDDEKKLFESKFYTPDNEFIYLTVSTGVIVKSPLVRMWSKEIKEVNNVQEIEYKPLNNRFYYLSSEAVHTNILVDTESASIWQRASIKGTTMQEVVNDNYRDTNKIFTDTRIHHFELNLSAYDFKSLDLKKVYYIEQEGQYYLFNKAIWESGKIAIGEFLRVKKI